MREIKFRAWDKKDVDEPRMVYFPMLGYSEYVDLNEQIKCSQLNRLILMQYTGLKDKNSKEIYEGDIVREENESGKFDYQIKWEEYDCCFYPHALFKSAIQGRMSSNYTEFKIIGNIYQNKDLLK